MILTKQQREDLQSLVELDGLLRKKTLTLEERKILWAWYYMLIDAQDAFAKAEKSLDGVFPVYRVLCSTDKIVRELKAERARLRGYYNRIITRLGLQHD